MPADPYRLPAYADVPRTEAHFMRTSDAIGPLGAKSMSESPFNPVAPGPGHTVRAAPAARRRGVRRPDTDSTPP